MSKQTAFDTDLRRALEPVRVSFHVPGHKYGQAQQRGGYSPDPCYGLDTTEIPGTDNLHDPEEMILAAQERASGFYRSRESFYLVNGSTSGVLAMLLAALNPGDKVLMGRDCHQSAFHGAWLAQAEIVWLMPAYDDSTLMNLGIGTETVRQALEAHPDAKALLVTYPTYFGLCTDLQAVAALCRARGVLLLVDEAHGAHLPLSPSLPMTALAAGADLCVQSTHKTLPALTQSAMLHVGSGRVDRERLRWMLRMVQTSSPSYLLMRSLDQAVALATDWGPGEMERLLADIDRLQERLAPVPDLLSGRQTWCGRGAVVAADPTKLILKGPALGLSGPALSEALRGFGIQMELSTPWYTLGVATIGNGSADIRSLGDALLQLAATAPQGLAALPEPLALPELPDRVMSWRNAAARPRETVSLSECIGRTAAAMVTPYPPGIPVLMPGERITESAAVYLEACLRTGISVIGLELKGAAGIPVVRP